MQYTTGVQVNGAVSPLLRQEGKQALGAPSPFTFPGAHQDVYAGLAQNNATGFDRAAQMADMETMKQTRDTQIQMALRGLGQMAQAQDNARSVANQLYGNQTGFLSGLLSGLFK